MRCADSKGAGVITQLVFGNLTSWAFSPQAVNAQRKGDPLNADIRTITDALEAKGVFGLACILDPEALVNVALSLAGTPDPNEYRMWLGFYAARFQVTTHALAVDVLTVLSYAADYVGAGIAGAAQSEVRQLAMVLCNSLK